MTDETELDLIYAALADPTRRAILARLAQGEATVLELAEPFEISLPAVSRHLKVLTRAGLIRRTRDAQWLRCRLEPTALDEARDWIDQQRNHWEASLSRLDDLLYELQKPDAGRSTEILASDERTE
jgi:DNA-binding transcriptional ArsR family regulator